MTYVWSRRPELMNSQSLLRRKLAPSIPSRVDIAIGRSSYTAMHKGCRYKNCLIAILLLLLQIAPMRVDKVKNAS